MFCPNCGREILNPSRFCPNCGTPIVQKESSQENRDAIVSDTIDCNETSSKKAKNGNGIKFLLISGIITAAYIPIVSLFSDGIIFDETVAIVITLLLFVSIIVTFVAAIMAIKKSKNTEKKIGKDLGILFITLNCIILIFLAWTAWEVTQEDTSDIEKNAGNDSAVINIAEDESIEEIEDDENATDWETYQPLYIGTIPVGCLMVPDANPDNVSDCLKTVLNRDIGFFPQRYNSQDIKYKIVVEDLLDIYGCTGIAIFNFDWNDTLSSIVFKFEDDGSFTPELFNKLHDEISEVLGLEGCSSELLNERLKESFPDQDFSNIHEVAEYGKGPSCYWDENEQPFECRLKCYFYPDGRPDGGQISFYRTVCSECINYSIVEYSDTDTIVQNGVTVSAHYHDGSYPYVTGTITNNSSKTVSFVKIKIALYDSNDKVIDTTWTYAIGAEGIAPGESSKWETYCSDAEAIKISFMD